MFKNRSDAHDVLFATNFPFRLNLADLSSITIEVGCNLQQSHISVRQFFIEQKKSKLSILLEYTS